MTTGVESLSAILNTETPSRLKPLLAHVQKLQQLNGLLKTCLSSPLQEHCKVANWREGCLVIQVDSAVWATHLRYQLTELQKNLRAIPGWETLKSIRYYVRA